MIIQIKNKMKKNFNKVILKFKVQLYKKLNLRIIKIMMKKFLRNSKINKTNLKFQFKIKIKNQNYLLFKPVIIK
jgi:hypothetical protein